MEANGETVVHKQILKPIYQWLDHYNTRNVELPTLVYRRVDRLTTPPIDSLHMGGSYTCFADRPWVVIKWRFWGRSQVGSRTWPQLTPHVPSRATSHHAASACNLSLSSALYIVQAVVRHYRPWRVLVNRTNFFRALARVTFVCLCTGLGVLFPCASSSAALHVARA